MAYSTQEGTAKLVATEGIDGRLFQVFFHIFHTINRTGKSRG